MTETVRAGATRLRQAPGPARFGDSFRNLSTLGKDTLGFFREVFATHGDVVRIQFPGLLIHGLNHPDLARHVLQERQQLYSKGSDYEIMKPLLGEGLLTSNGAFWKRQRRLAQPAFHRQKIVAFAELMVARASAVAAGWTAAPGTVDLHSEMMRLTLAIVGEALFGAELTADSHTIGQALDGVLRLFMGRSRSLWVLVPLWVPIPSHRAFVRDRRALVEVVDRIIAERRAHGNAGRSDLLSMLMEARDEEATAEGPAGGNAMTDAQLRDECMTMMLAGHETTANLLTWTFLLLAQNPAIAARLRDEVDSVLRGAPPTLEDLPKLGCVDRVLKESLRLFPPAWAISRVLSEDDEVQGFRLPAGSEVVLSQYLIQRRPDFWPDPERFDPDRFLEAEEKKRPRFAYFPFGGGPRQCIGNLFAMLEAQLILIVLLQRTQVTIDPGLHVVAEPSITLRPKHGLPAAVGARA